MRKISCTRKTGAILPGSTCLFIHHRLLLGQAVAEYHAEKLLEAKENHMTSLRAALGGSSRQLTAGTLRMREQLKAGMSKPQAKHSPLGKLPHSASAGVGLGAHQLVMEEVGD
jgi:hypothetical protein